jgi:hypothetical protein
MEIWKKIEGFGNYSVSSEGRVKNESTGLILKTSIPKRGYHHWIVKKNGKRFNFRIHRLVAKAFIPNPKNLDEVNHINGNKTDNRIENLEWCTHSENVSHSFSIGLQSTKGINHPLTKLSENDVLGIRKLYSENVPQTDIAKIYNYSYGAINKIVNRKNWTHI